MYDANDLVRLIKKAAVEAVEASSPTDFYVGKILSVSPLTIKLDQKLILNKRDLLLTATVCDHHMDITADHRTELENAHTHGYKGRKKFMVHRGLQVGENVVLAMSKGGEKYIVLDRVVKP